MYPAIETLSELLLKENYVSAGDDAAAKAVSDDSEGYVEYLLSQQLLSKTLLGQAIAEAYDIDFADLERTPPSDEFLGRVDEATARANRVVMIRESGSTVTLASDAPADVDADRLGELFRRKDVELAYALPEQVTQVLTRYEQPLEIRLSDIIKSGGRIAPELIDEIIKDGLALHASDIHIEPAVDGVIIRFRIDGALREVGRLPLEYYDNILNRLKVESGMRIDEHYSAQDGSIRLELDDASVDLRVSLVPTIRGEKAVMRVLGSYTRGFNIADLGLSDAHRHQFEEAARRPFGMILTTGPTGSGKTTSLYALLKLLNNPGVNITTIEDPVEYQLAGINQIQVRRSSDLDFSSGLRAIVRQDPDIILVGEIRDRETAEISVNAALTGHLLLSTFHANDAASSIPRLIDMGIEPFLLSSTLEMILAQRLVRKICPKCKRVVSLDEAVEALPEPLRYVREFFNASDSLYGGAGCASCNGTGYQGRTALYEIISVTPAMAELIAHSPTAAQIAELAHGEGAISMFEDGISKARGGATTLAEVVRVVRPPEPGSGPIAAEPAAKPPVEPTPPKRTKSDKAADLPKIMLNHHASAAHKTTRHKSIRVSHDD